MSIVVSYLCAARTEENWATASTCWQTKGDHDNCRNMVDPQIQGLWKTSRNLLIGGPFQLSQLVTSLLSRWLIVQNYFLLPKSSGTNANFPVRQEVKDYVYNKFTFRALCVHMAVQGVPGPTWALMWHSWKDRAYVQSYLKPNWLPSKHIPKSAVKQPVLPVHLVTWAN